MNMTKILERQMGQRGQAPDQSHGIPAVMDEMLRQSRELAEYKVKAAETTVAEAQIKLQAAQDEAAERIKQAEATLREAQAEAGAAGLRFDSEKRRADAAMAETETLRNKLQAMETAMQEERTLRLQAEAMAAGHGKMDEMMADMMKKMQSMPHSAAAHTGQSAGKPTVMPKAPISYTFDIQRRSDGAQFRVTAKPNF